MRISACNNTGYASGTVILFRALISTITRSLRLSAVSFYITKYRNKNGVKELI